MKEVRIFLIFYFSVMFLAILSSLFEEEIISNPFDYARITDVEYKAVLVDEPDNGGKVIITERLTFDIHAASSDNLFWELWRDLPESEVDGLKIDYKVNSVKQIYKDGSEVVYTKSPRLYWDDYDYVGSSLGYGPGKWFHSKGPYSEFNRSYECVFFYVDGLYREEVVFEIEYEMSNAALKYNDVSELYLTFYSEDSIKYLDSFKGQILISNKDMPSKGNYEAYTYGTNEGSFTFTESDTLNPGYHTFSFDLDKDDLKFNKHTQYIEFYLMSYNEDSHIFTDYAPNNLYSHEDALDELKEEHQEYVDWVENNKQNKFILFIISLVVSGLIIITTINKDRNIRKKHIFFKPSNDITYFRDIPSNLDPYFAAALVFSKHGEIKDETNGYSAIMLSLIRKKYIELEKIDNSKGWFPINIKIIIKYRPVQNNLSNSIITNTEPTLAQLVNNTLKSQNELIFPGENVTNINNSSFVVEPSTQELYASNFEPLTETEKHYFRLIYRHAQNYEIEMIKFQSRVSDDYENTSSFVKSVDSEIINIGISKGYFQKADYKQVKNMVKLTSKMFMIFGILSITLFNLILAQTPYSLAYGGFTIIGVTLILCSLYLKKLSNKYILFTQYGEDEYSKWRGLYNFLNSATLMSERTVIELPIWEQYLVYATAFGISDKVIKALEIRCPDIELSPMLRNPYYRSSGYRHTSRSFRSATRSATYTSRSRSYSSYGGGGRGGGGGGGGH